MPQQKIRLKVTQASLNQTAFDLPRNMANIYEAVRIAAAEGSDILALEELTLTGYEANDDFQKTDNSRILACLKDIAAYANALDPNLIVSVGHPWRLTIRDEFAAPGPQPDIVKDPLFNREGLPFNVQTIIGGGRIHGMTAKANLFNYERGYEKRYFQEWSMATARLHGGIAGTIMVPLEPGGQEIPFGRPIFSVGDEAQRFNLAQAICEEKWVATRYDDGAAGDERDYARQNIIPMNARVLGDKKGLVLLIADASPPAPGKIEKHEMLARIASGYADVVVNTDGLGSSGSTFAQFGHRLVAQNGRIIGAGARLSFARVATNTTSVEINAAKPYTARATEGHIKHEFSSKAAMSSRGATWDDPAYAGRTFEETVRMTALWLFDYMAKTKSGGIAQALSGGADSAFNSVIVSAMVHLAVKELGVDGFCERMAHLPYADKIRAAGQAGGAQAAIDECLAHMLTCVYMGTNNSSDRTRNAARFLMQGDPAAGIPGIGGKYLERNVQDLLDFYGVLYAVEDTTKIAPARLAQLSAAVSGFLNRQPGTIVAADLAQEEAQIRAAFPEIQRLASVANPAELVAYENIQARGRQVLIMMIANMEGKMAVANPNLDEARNGYSTFGGDLHSGTINLNAHLPKAFQLQVMRYLYEHGLQGVMPPVRALEKVLANKPSAELQPKNAAGEVVQNDEDALKGSFEQLNRIAELMIHERVRSDGGPRRLNACEIYDACRTDSMFAAVDDDRLYEMICFRYRRWSLAQHKIHASPVAPTYGRNVDHQTSLRTPNLNGGGWDELTLLGVRAIFDKAARDGAVPVLRDRGLIERRAIQDEAFVDRFEKLLKRGRPSFDYDVQNVYEHVKAQGWDGVFGALPASHPLVIVHNAGNGSPKLR